MDKQTRKPASIKCQGHRAVEKLEFIHSDSCGSMSEPTWGGTRYLFMFTDDFTHKTFENLLKSKDETLAKYKEFKVRVNNETRLCVKKIRTDNGTEYTSPEFEGISPAVCCLDAGLGRKFRGEAVMSASYLKKKTSFPTVALIGVTPEED
ncbi:hypothetical protein PR048_002203 [Dryococelus australis]|uniref:Integrase catalytic domain-containing protein n=1 Tax=Dryococelus australis TaxID=614101 RepID=A0ABQ9IK90_9NEOP|nr:hypothetical protein PR048_002203 [Dryococelus australis]